MLLILQGGRKEKRRKEGRKWEANAEIEVYGDQQTGTDFGVKWRLVQIPALQLVWLCDFGHVT